MQLSYSPDSVRTIQIRTDMKSSVYYLPYKPVSYPENAAPYLDTYVRNQSQLTQYSVDYTPATPASPALWTAPTVTSFRSITRRFRRS